MSKLWIFVTLLTFMSTIPSAIAECLDESVEQRIQRHNDDVATSVLIGTLLESTDSFANKNQACALVRFLDADLKLSLCIAQKSHKNVNDGWGIVIRNTEAALQYSKPITEYCSGNGDLKKARSASKGNSETDMFPAYDPLLWN